MNRSFFPLLALVITFLNWAAPVLAQYEEGQHAFDAGDYLKAQEAWKKCAEGEDARCQYSLGYLMQFGMVGSADLVSAKSWYEKAAANKSADALYALGLMHESGQGADKDLGKAFDYYHQAAAAGVQSDAEYAIGRMLLRGRGVPRDAKESVVWLKKAAQHGNPAAQYMLAASYEAGWGMPVNEGEAYYWYRRADQGDPVELEEQDVSFAPKIAIAALRKRLPADVVAFYDAKLKHDLAALKAKPAEKKKEQPALTKPAN
jgi:TPR repeat protein